MTYDTTTETNDTLRTWDDREHNVTIKTHANHGTFTSHLSHTALPEDIRYLEFNITTDNILNTSHTEFTAGAIHTELCDDTDATIAEETTDIKSLNHSIKPGYAFMTAIEITPAIPFDTIDTIHITIDPTPSKPSTDTQSTPASDFTINISRPNTHNNAITATVHYPNNTTQTVSATPYATDGLMHRLDTLITAYNPNTPDALNTTLCTRPKHRAQLAIDALNEYDGCLETRYWDMDNEVLAFLSITNTEPLEELEFICNMTSQHSTIAFNREHGLHLRVHWCVHKYGINYEVMDDFDRTEFIQKYADKTPRTWQTIDTVLAKHSEHHTATTPIVTNKTISDTPRIAGTDNHALHIAWLIRERNEPREELTGNTFETLTETDIDNALEYANNHPNAYEAYAKKKLDLRNTLENNDREFIPLNTDTDTDTENN